MKVSQNWLKNLVEISSTPEDLSEKLSIGGFEVESLEDCSENVNGVVLGRVLSVLKHEGSDKLSICCLLYTSPSPRDKRQSRMPSSA